MRSPSKTRRSRIVAGALSVALVAAGAGINAQAADEDEPEVILTQVSHDAENNVKAGEAWMVADPRNSDNLTVIWLGTSNSEDPTKVFPPKMVLPGYCGIGRSSDGGRTWSLSKAPYQGDTVPGTLPICGDPAGGITPDGAIIFTAVQLGSNDWLQSITSRDNGATWTVPTAPFSAVQWGQAVAGSGTLQDLGPGRQFTAVDQTTGDMYVQSQVDVATFGRTIVASTDDGATWTVPRNVGSTSLGPIGAAFGKVAGVYTSGTDKIFQVSDDFGQTWEYNTMPVGPTSGRGSVAADPTQEDRFAVLVSAAANTLELWTTQDAGETWSMDKSIVAEGDDTIIDPALAFAPNGALGIRWRSNDPGTGDTPYDIDAVVSPDGGTTWNDAVRLTAARGSAPATGGIGDDCACTVTMTNTTLSAQWGDATSGNREIWFGSFDYTEQ